MNLDQLTELERRLKAQAEHMKGVGQRLKTVDERLAITLRVAQFPVYMRLRALQWGLRSVKDPAERNLVINLVWSAGGIGLQKSVDVPKVLELLRALPDIDHYLKDLPSPVTLYRGFATSKPEEAEALARRISWSPSLDIACYFARWWHGQSVQPSASPYIASASVMHEGIVAYFPSLLNDQHIPEVLVDPAALTDLVIQKVEI